MSYGSSTCIKGIHLCLWLFPHPAPFVPYQFSGVCKWTTTTTTKASGTSFPDRPKTVTMECGLGRNAFVFWLFLERCSTQGNNEELTRWSSEKVCILNVGLLFPPLPFQHVGAIWERSSVYKRRLKSLFVSVNEERNSLSRIWRVWDQLWDDLSTLKGGWGPFASVPHSHQAGPLALTERTPEGRALQNTPVRLL